MVTEDGLEILVIDKDWGSTALRSGDGSNYTGYKWLDLPQWPMDRLDYWSCWYESYPPDKTLEEMNWEAFEIVGERFVVCYGCKERVVNAVPFNPVLVPHRDEIWALSKRRTEE